MRTPRNGRLTGLSSDGGEIQLALAAATGATLLIVTILIGASAGIGQQETSGCQPQPAPARQAIHQIPRTYLTLYQKAGQTYGIAWNLLAAVGKIESDHGTDPSPGVRSGSNYAGAAGPMQIGIGGAAGNTWGGTPRHRATQTTSGYSTDGDGDGWADVYNPADAIPAAARILKDHGAPGNIRQALFAYNHDLDYVATVLAQADQYAAQGAQVIAAADTSGCVQAALGPLPASAAAGQVIVYARAQLGKPYLWGATGPDSYDCSGLTMTAYRSAGISIPRQSQAQYRWGAPVASGHEQPGDLVFFHMEPDGPGHVGIVYNPAQGTMIAAPHRGANVRVQPYKNYPGGPIGFTRPTKRS